MRFTTSTLISTTKRFSAVLKANGLELPFGKANDVWTQIVLGRNFSAARSYVSAQEIVDAIPISEDAVRKKLAHRSREIDRLAVCQLLAEVLQEDISLLSPCMAALVGVLRSNSPQTCLTRASADRFGLGIIETTKAGYLPISQIKMSGDQEKEMSWLKSSSEFVANVVNQMAGIDGHLYGEIFAANFRAGRAWEDTLFAFHMSDHIDSCSDAVAKAVLLSFDPGAVQDWDAIDFDEIRDIVVGAIEVELAKANDNWLKAECQLGEALSDHLGARIRETMKWLYTQANDGEDVDPLYSLTYSAKLSMSKLLEGRRPS
jgi:hypothetical protein